MKAVITALCLLIGTAAQAQDLTIFAAASLKEPLDQLLLTQPGVVVSYGGSGMLAQQVIAGAPADLVFLAHPDWMQAMDDAGVLTPGSRIDLLGNQIVLVAPAGTDAFALTPEALTRALGSEGRLAIGMTTSVPAGLYGRAALESLGLWDAVKDRLAEVDNVRAALTLTERGETPLGLVYRTDARVTPNVGIVATFPDASNEPILYQAATVAGGDPAAEDLLDLLASPEGQATFAAAGFVPLAAP
ncbi:molybdate ABC transporter substrate-binding protein [Loktanella sp. DJP18]|uniref:molybdate ABC transporter substrate-binding protein n=1 Tax=Loktanella sp. DJP18 TaxID=3409788 RepID=UPI003BB59238